MILRVGNDNCLFCSLYQDRTQVVKNVVNTEAEICFHGLGPGESEDKEGVPFIGRAGGILKGSINKHYDISKVSFTNSVLCLPPDNKINKTMTSACLYNFQESIKQMPNLKIVVLLGTDAYKAVTGNAIPMKKVYLQMFQLPEYGEIYFLPCYHPASILYNPTPEAIDLFHNGIKTAFTILKARKVISKPQKYVNILNKEQLDKALQLIYNQPQISIDTETTGLQFSFAEMICLAVCFEERTAIAIPWKWGVEKLDYYWPEAEREKIRKTFVNYFNDESKGVCAHNSKFDSLIFFKEFGSQINNIRFDTMTASFILDSNSPNDLESCTVREIPENAGRKKSFWANISEADKESGTWWRKKTLDETLDYCCEDADNTFSLAKIYAGKL